MVAIYTVLPPSLVLELHGCNDFCRVSPIAYPLLAEYVHVFRHPFSDIKAAMG